MIRPLACEGSAQGQLGAPGSRPGDNSQLSSAQGVISLAALPPSTVWKAPSAVRSGATPTPKVVTAALPPAFGSARVSIARGGGERSELTIKPSPVAELSAASCEGVKRGSATRRSRKREEG